MYLEKNSGSRTGDKVELSQYEIKVDGQQVYLVNQRMEAIEVSASGSLATLALGQIGIEAWRMAKELQK